MADEPTPGELYRRLQDHENRSDRVHSDLDNRITRMAAESVPLDVWHQAERARDQQISRLEQEHQADIADAKAQHDADLVKFRQDVIKPIDRRLGEVEKRPVPMMTFSRWVGVLTLVGTFLGVLVAAYATSKGAK